jgi:RHS repeat-associated protein
VWDRRIGKKLDLDGNGIFDDVRFYIYDGERFERGFAGDNIVLVFDQSSLLTNVKNRYLYGPAVDQILADEQVTNVYEPGNVHWALTDNLGSVRDVIDHDAATDITTVVNHITYDSYGNRTSETNPGINSLHGFAGREFDEATGLSNYRARIYDAAIAQFLSEDPIYDDYNYPRRYAGNSPTNAIDPSGLQPPSTGTDLGATMIEALTHLPETGIAPVDGFVRNLREFWNRPIYSPIPRSARGRITSLPFNPRPDLWDGSLEHPNTITPRDIYLQTGEMLVEAATALAPASQGRQACREVVTGGRQVVVATRAARARTSTLPNLGDRLPAVRQASAPVRPVRIPANVVQRTNSQLVQDIARRAEAWGTHQGLGNGPVAGTLKHGYADRLLTRYQQRFGNRGLSTEVRYINGAPWQQGIDPLRGSIRLDVVEGPLNNPTCVWDYKFGSAQLTPARIKRIRTGAGLGPNVPVNPIFP